jgi:hypothetical protein
MFSHFFCANKNRPHPGALASHVRSVCKDLMAILNYKLYRNLVLQRHFITRVSPMSSLFCRRMYKKFDYTAPNNETRRLLARGRFVSFQPFANRLKPAGWPSSTPRTGRRSAAGARRRSGQSGRRRPAPVARSAAEG